MSWHPPLQDGNTCAQPSVRHFTTLITDKHLRNHPIKDGLHHISNVSAISQGYLFMHLICDNANTEVLQTK